MLRNYLLPVLMLVFVQCFAYASPSDVDSSESTIEFVKLEAIVSNKVIHFSWDVKTERSGDYFIIEKSVDEENWKSVTRVASINNKHSHTYRTSQINLVEGAYEYFRLVRVDKSGESTILDRVNINHPVLASILLIPVHKSRNKEFIVSYTSMICCSGKVTITDNYGEVILKKKVHLDKGYNRITLDTKNYALGNYTIVVSNEYGNSLEKKLRIESPKVRRAKF